MLARKSIPLSLARLPLSQASRISWLREYHDQSFGYREARRLTVPDYTPAQLQNRNKNAPLLRYVDALRLHGHRAARVDPLDLLERQEVAALDPKRYGLVDGEKKYSVDGILWTHETGMHLEGDEAAPDSKLWKLNDIIKLLREVYVGRVAYEFMHSPHKNERLWFSHFLESFSAKTPFDEQAKLRLWSLLTRSETFDHFLQAKFPNLKRYGLEGAESMLAALDRLFYVASKAGVEHVILAMPHRGRLSLLTDLLQYSPTALFHKIKGGFEFPESLGATGDVISHLAASPTLEYEGARKPIKVLLLQNPSHLEAINPVALGKTRAKQYSLLKGADPDCTLGDRVMCVQMHGDAAFTGQGVVMEGLGLSNLPHFTSGGSVHIVVNIGYTTPASSARSSLYCSDIGKMINAPVLHVNGDYPEDVAHAIDVAFSYRNFFRKDIIVDLITYRRWGHNELDEPAFTQPLMYHKIRSRQSVPKLYEEKLISEGTLTAEKAASLRTSYKKHLDEQLQAVPAFAPEANMLKAQWSDMRWPATEEAVQDPETGVDEATLKRVGKESVTVPVDFEIHPRLQRHVNHRQSSLQSGAGIDWGTAEALAFGSLMLEGHDVRISGQDVGRGTFSHRHAMLVDQRSERVYVPLNTVSESAKLELANSSLSEFAVLGFEYGMSWENPNMLPIWEAQFGDFFNGAQVIIDTFISSSETKWLKQSGLVMLLPHGLDGAGPEHSSCRIERMLQLTNAPFAPTESANVNMHVVNPTTPAQYFHLLRRQLKRNFRKPLIVAAPKGLLRLPAAASSLQDFAPGTRFLPVISPSVSQNATPERVLILSGKVYYEVMKEIDARALAERVQVVRLEEIAPFPFTQLGEALQGLGVQSGTEVYWVQEEAKNQGAWSFVEPRLGEVLKALGRSREDLKYVGRPASAVPAVGVATVHAQEKKQLFEEALAFA
ncbi:hypothetical protein BOTBODRAFT_116863 [Botryobasidium botryosum FD-172 SS1]|uniref:Transketolase-like pyrimidine-binding domain-containing protein n=1 Tax=Botryobasidium botryosum (strain FD-172 SS1) TaxID=930990 RepID=A0A067MCH4_BOTB1|nr:hypothetical protein BOTBODRAFT_116863 [Botryobasidium botryosum FD-172 SS1]